MKLKFVVLSLLCTFYAPPSYSAHLYQQPYQYQLKEGFLGFGENIIVAYVDLGRLKASIQGALRLALQQHQASANEDILILTQILTKSIQKIDRLCAASNIAEEQEKMSALTHMLYSAHCTARCIVETLKNQSSKSEPAAQAIWETIKNQLAQVSENANSIRGFIAQLKPQSDSIWWKSFWLNFCISCVVIILILFCLNKEEKKQEEDLKKNLHEINRRIASNATKREYLQNIIKRIM